MISIIACVSAGNGAIGRRGQLIYNISADLRRFKELTTGHTVVMGRKTFLSLPKGALPNRRNIVITTDPHFAAPGVETANSLQKAIEMAANPSAPHIGPDSEIFIIGGASVYQQAMPFAQRLLLTIVDDGAGPADADTFFPPIDRTKWEQTDASAPACDPRSNFQYQFVTFLRP